MIDESASHGDPLLLAAGELGGKMIEAVCEAYSRERRARFGFVGGAMEILSKHDIFKSGEIRNEMKLLEDEADFLGAEARKAFFVEARDVGASHESFA